VVSSVRYAIILVQQARSPGKPLATDCLPSSSRPKGSWLLGFDGLSAATQCSALSGNHRVTLCDSFSSFCWCRVSGMGVYLEKTISWFHL